MTTPELVKRWWNANRGEVTVAEIDLRVGGKWRSVMWRDNGMEVGFHGEYREIVPNERIVSTEVYEGMPERRSSQHDDPHRVRRAGDLRDPRAGTRARSIETLSIESGMEAGMQDAMDLLEEVAVSLASR